MVGFGQFREQPLHFVLLQRHVDLDGRVTGDGRGDAGADLFQVQRLFFARELLEQFMQHVLDGAASTPAGATFTATLRAPKGSASNPLCCSSSEISEKTACCAGASSSTIGMSRRWLSTFCAARCFSTLLEKDALVGDVLVDDPEAIFVHGEDERIADLSERLEGAAETTGSARFLIDVERGSTAVVGDRFPAASRQRDSRIRFDGDASFELKALGNRRR